MGRRPFGVLADRMGDVGRLFCMRALMGVREETRRVRGLFPAGVLAERMGEATRPFCMRVLERTRGDATALR